MSAEQIEWPSPVPVLPSGPPEVWRIERHGETWTAEPVINDAGAHRAGCPDHPEGVR